MKLNYRVARWTGWAIGRVLDWINFLDEDLRKSNMDDWHEHDKLRHELADEIAQLEAENMKLQSWLDQTPSLKYIQMHDKYKAENARLREAIQRALDDEESGDGWGPDVTVCTYLREALQEGK